MAIKAIVFDCFGVLVTSARVALKNDYPKYIRQIDNLCHQYDYGVISRQQFDDELARLFMITSKQVESRYWAKMIRYEKVVEWVRRLKTSGKYKIGMLSNVGPNFMNDFFDPMERNELFDEVILSSEVGIAKPNAAAYQMIADKLGVKLSECVMIDDTYLNIDAAKSIGMHGIWFISVDQARDELDKILEVENA